MNELEWQENGVPVSQRFDDPYYSTENGRAETHYVFLEGNRLPMRWQGLQSCTIAELGFGTGLNFLETVHNWELSKREKNQIHYISFEKYPLSGSQMLKALSAWPELDALAKKLGSNWETDDQLLDIEFSQNIHLTVHFGDANVLLPEQTFKADAWYLDGFSPAKNPELWNEELMQEVAAHTVAGGTFATYTAAGFVRRGLQNAGFEVNKTKGYGRKRDMMVGTIPNDIHVAK